MKPILRHIIILLFLTSKSILTVAQGYADKSFYLLDSISLEEISQVDRVLLDSVLKIYHQSNHDTIKMKVIQQLSEELYNEEIWPKYNDLLRSKAKKSLENKTYQTEREKLLLQQWYSSALNNVGYLAESRGNFQTALTYYEKCLKIQLDIHHKGGIATTYSNMGIVHENLGNINKALKLYEKCLSLRLEINDSMGLAQIYNNLGAVYINLGDLEKALAYSLKSLKLKEQLGRIGSMGFTLNNIAHLYMMQEDFEKGIEYYEKALDINLKMGYKKGVAHAYNNLGVSYNNIGQKQKALDYYIKGKNIREEIGDKWGLAGSYFNLGAMYLSIALIEKENYDSLINLSEENYLLGIELSSIIEDIQLQSVGYTSIGEMYRKKGDYEKATQNIKKGLELSQKIGYPDKISESSFQLYKLYKLQGNISAALQMYELHVVMKDSLVNTENKKSFVKQQTQYEYEKNKALDDKENEKKIAIEIEKQKKQYIILIIVIIATSLIFILLLIIYRRLRITRKQKIIIEEQKEEVESQRDQIEEQRDDILASINYAKRIQNAILPPDSQMKEYLPDSFVLYKPKDVVAGDFYWLEPMKEGVLFAVADCTGHGVPGAMVSVVCHNAMNRVVREFGLVEPGKILDKTREIVVGEFEKSQEDVKDGMDIALCYLQEKEEHYTLHYAGAYNPLWIVRKGQNEIEEIKADRQPIGKFESAKTFTTHTIELQPEDSIYIFSDGYADQFGGEEDKKFSSKKIARSNYRYTRQTYETTTTTFK